MKKTYSLAMLLTLLAGLMFSGAVMAAEHAGDAAESDSSSSSEHAAQAKGDEHAGDAAKSDKADHDSDAEHAGDSAASKDN